MPGLLWRRRLQRLGQTVSEIPILMSENCGGSPALLVEAVGVSQFSVVAVAAPVRGDRDLLLL